MKKLRRLMAPREDGSYLVPSQFVEMWKDQSDGGGRDQIKQLWNQVGGDKDCCVRSLNCSMT